MHDNITSNKCMTAAFTHSVSSGSCMYKGIVPHWNRCHLYTALTFGTKSGMESVTHVSRSRWLRPGWTPKFASKMASLVHIPQTQVRSKTA